MAKVKTQPAVTAQVVVATPVQAPTLYTIGKLPRNGLHQTTKHGNGGTAGTYAAVVAALQAATPPALPMATLQAVCKANNDPGFAKYAVRSHWLLPYVPQA